MEWLTDDTWRKIEERRQLKAEVDRARTRREKRNAMQQYRPLSHGGHFESQENKKLCFSPSSLALDERLDGQNLLFQHCVIKVYGIQGKQVKAACRRDKRGYINQVVTDAEEAARKGDLNRLCQTTRILSGRRPNQSKPFAIRRVTSLPKLTNNLHAGRNTLKRFSIVPRPQTNLYYSLEKISR